MAIVPTLAFDGRRRTRACAVSIDEILLSERTQRTDQPFNKFQFIRPRILKELKWRVPDGRSVIWDELRLLLAALFQGFKEFTHRIASGQTDQTTDDFIHLFHIDFEHSAKDVQVSSSSSLINIKPICDSICPIKTENEQLISDTLNHCTNTKLQIP